MELGHRPVAGCAYDSRTRAGDCAPQGPASAATWTRWQLWPRGIEGGGKYKVPGVQEALLCSVLSTYLFCGLRGFQNCFSFPEGCLLPPVPGPWMTPRMAHLGLLSSDALLLDGLPAVHRVPHEDAVLCPPALSSGTPSPHLLCLRPCPPLLRPLGPHPGLWQGPCRISSSPSHCPPGIRCALCMADCSPLASAAQAPCPLVHLSSRPFNPVSALPEQITDVSGFSGGPPVYSQHQSLASLAASGPTPLPACLPQREQHLGEPLPAPPLPPASSSSLQPHPYF